MRTTARLFSFLVLAALGLAANAPAFGAANIVVVNTDGPNEGGVITGAQKGAIQSCAAQADIP